MDGQSSAVTIRNRTAANEAKYKMYRNKLTNIKRFCEKNYYTKLIENNKKNVKNIWRVLNEIINKKVKSNEYPDQFKTEDGSIISDMKTIANKFNEFFVNVGPNLAKQVRVDDNSNIYDYLGSMNPQSMFLLPVSETEIINTVRLCKNKNSEDFNNLSMHVVKDIVEPVIKPFQYICNLSFKNGVVPNNMKIAKIIPLFKNGDKSVFTNYRPVALLPQFSKILEKLFCKRLNEFIDKHDLIVNSQYGFRANRSTSSALLELVEDITTALDKNKYTVGVFIDLRKAFDTIDHTLLLKKLEHYGIRGIVNKWLCSYLSKRKQYVEIDQESSNLLDVLCGVPQGSVLGPLLFLLYINDICNVSKLLKLILFADDTNLFRSGLNLEELCKEISNELSKLNKWFKVNKLSLNVSKTNFMIFAGRKKCIDAKIYIDNFGIELVHTTKFLGIIIDDKLNWKPHVSTVSSKLSKCFFVLYKSSKILDILSLKTLYCSLFLPYLSYCCEVWGTTYKTTVGKLEVLQKKSCTNSM